MTPDAGAPTARERILTAAVRRIASEGIDGVRIARLAMDAAGRRLEGEKGAA